ncbi:photosynthetic protein synthase I (plasmid) [Vibrio sp. qd031]|uniref:SCO family protein n=1 Tax=Vibrio sp. qd031 TaxID=1603038 RepID=UPI000A0FF91C|nr:SCO family protein [Vibrio sp. qd031]ORT52396.1 photosynthetic protein synthase I [Vibrio sp. qd031]
MSKNWTLVLVVAFALGFATKLYFDGQQEITHQQAQQGSAMVVGNDGVINLFDPQDSRIRILYFGFTRCPDVCPTSLAMLSGAYNQLDDETLNQYYPVFVTLDPERDKGEDAHKYSQYFHPRFSGVAGTTEVTEELAKRYGVIYQKTELEDSALEYSIDHNSYFYFVDNEGKLITKVPHTLSPDPIKAAMLQLTQDAKE